MKLSIRTVSSNPPYFSLAVTCTIRLRVLHSRAMLFCVSSPCGPKTMLPHIFYSSMIQGEDKVHDFCVFLEKQTH